MTTTIDVKLDILRELEYALEETKKKPDETNVGLLLSVIDMMIETGMLNKHPIQNSKILGRIAINNRRGYFHEKNVVLPNFDNPVSHYAQ